MRLFGLISYLFQQLSGFFEWPLISESCSLASRRDITLAIVGLEA
jgi:hypothetical protein